MIGLCDLIVIDTRMEVIRRCNTHYDSLFRQERTHPTNDGNDMGGWEGTHNQV